MKKLLLFVLVATVFAACSTDTTQDLAPEIPTAPDELQVSFDEEDTRIQLQNGTTVWTAGDLVSVFYRSDAHDKYEFQGETGDASGILKRVSKGTPTIGLDKVVAVYPYNENYLIELLTGNIQAFLPAEQTYLADSFGLGSSIMISSSRTDKVYLKNVCGWLKLQFTGNTFIRKIVLKGNDGEQVAGNIYITADDASCTLASNLMGADGTSSGDLEGTLVDTNTILTQLTLNCPTSVALNPDTPTAFYIALPPQTFKKGITATIYGDYGYEEVISTENIITIERNHILPMATINAALPMAINFIDPIFKSFIVEKYDLNLDGEINYAEAEAISSIDVSGIGITDMTGIEPMVNLTTLNCSNNNITQIDLSNNNALTSVSLNGCSNLAKIVIWEKCTAPNDYLTFDLGSNVAVEDVNGCQYGYPYYVGQYIPYCNGGVVYKTSNDGKNANMIALEEIVGYPMETQGSWKGKYGINWILPTKNEMVNISQSYTLINETLTARGHTPLGTDGYWSSSRYNVSMDDGTHYYGVYLVDGTIFHSSVNQKNPIRVIYSLD